MYKDVFVLLMQLGFVVPVNLHTQAVLSYHENPS